MEQAIRDKLMAIIEECGKAKYCMMRRSSMSGSAGWRRS
jgi:hypothetical protein